MGNLKIVGSNPTRICGRGLFLWGIVPWLYVPCVTSIFLGLIRLYQCMIIALILLIILSTYVYQLTCSTKKMKCYLKSVISYARLAILYIFI